MKKIYSFALVLLTLLSCVVFSACGNKYKDLTMKIYSSDGRELTRANFVIDTSKDSSQTLGVEFSGIDSKDIGEIVVNAVPQELITVENYSYTGKYCYVKIKPNMSSGDDAKLVVSHIASGKKKEIGLVIDKKSTHIELDSSEYAIAIPQTNSEPVEHQVEFSNLVKLLPSGSTDRIYFKLAEGSSLKENIKPINLTGVLGYEDVLTGFKVSPGEDSSVEIYPITYMQGYQRGESDPYKNLKITIYFKNALTEDNVKIQGDISEINLVANDLNFNQIKLSLVDKENNLLAGKGHFEFYDVETESSDKLKIYTFSDTNNNVIIKAQTHTDKYEDVVIRLKPKMAGNLQTIEKFVRVKGESKADKIYVEKFEEEVTDFENVNIFDYYDDGGNSLGALFTLKPIAFSGAGVHEDLRTMKIRIKPEILSEQNASDNKDKVNQTLYSLVIYHISLTDTEPFKDAAPLMFKLEDNMMVSEEINEDSKVYIKYAKNTDKDNEPESFGIEVTTINKSENEMWKDLENTKVSLNFNRLEGVKNVKLEAGYYYDVGSFYNSEVASKENPDLIYIDRTKGLDYINGDDSNHIFFVNVKNNSVEGVSGGKITSVKFTVKVEPLNQVENPLKVHADYVSKDDPYNAENNVKGAISVTYSYNINIAYSDIITLVVRKDTSLGDYKITFYQEMIEKESLICRIYESLNGLTKENIDLETNLKAFKNKQDDGTLKYSQYKSDYIVASGQELDISINLPQGVVDSEIVDAYVFDLFMISDEFHVHAVVAEEPEPEINKYDYFNPLHDNSTLNYAKLQFLKGTFIAGKPQYVQLYVGVITNKFDDITKISEDKDLDNIFSISFFIYEEVNTKEISISHTSMTRYMSDYLGVYYNSLSNAELSISMKDEMWDYVLEIDRNVAGDMDKKVKWRIDDKVFVEFNEKSDHKFELKFNGSTDPYERTVSAIIQQFDNLYELKCVFFVEKPILTERVIIKNEVYEDKDGLYINLKDGDKDYKIEAENFSSSGNVTHDEIIIQITDENGSALTANDYFNIDQTNSKISVKKVDGLHTFTLIVFAKDVLSTPVSPEALGYNNPSNFIKNDFANAIDKNKYLNAYMLIKIHLSDGTYDTPYEIHDYKDFWEIDDSEGLRKSHYKLMNSISLDNSSYTGSRVIKDFSGSIRTDNEIFTIDGIELNAENLNLFQGFKVNETDENSGKISNIRFVVKYSYDISKNTSDVHLGLFDINCGTLNNVSAIVSGFADLSGTATYYFGGLAGENKYLKSGDNESEGIVYTTGYGVSGSIELAGDEKATIYFGGLVGRNYYAIKAYEEDTVAGVSDEIVLNSSSGATNAISMIEIRNRIVNSKESSVSQGAIGGVVGLNTYSSNSVGTIKDAYVQSNININASNVGGVIGENAQNSNSLNVASVTFEVDVDGYDVSKAISNIKSVAQIKANDCVGGIVGLDENGIYYDCDYQIVNMESKEVSLLGKENVGGIAGSSTYGKFIFCSVMSYNWKYQGLDLGDKSTITDTSNIIALSAVEDIQGLDYVGGIVGLANSSSVMFSSGDIEDRVIIVNSSVNAYLKATKQENESKVGNIGGLLSANGGAVVYNAYFIGKLEGELNYALLDDKNPRNLLILDNDNSSNFNSVYTLNLEDDQVVIGSKLNGANFKNWFESWDSDITNYWGWIKNVNGGHIFITKDENSNQNSVPIFDLAPESIEVTVKDAYNKGSNNEEKEKLKRVLMLEYYDFSKNYGITDDELNKLDLDYNKTINVLDAIFVKANPVGLGKVVVNVRSTNSNVVDISNDGKLMVNGIGECDLIFTSILNPDDGNEINRTIRVIVDYPIGDDFNLTKYLNDYGKKLNGTEKIAKDTTKQYYVLTSGSEILYEHTVYEKTYSYKTKTNVHLKFEVGYSFIDANFDIAEYVSICGLSYIDEDSNGTKGESPVVVKLDDKTPLTISVLKMLETGVFNISVKPFVVVNGVEVYLKNSAGSTVETKFDLSTIKGVTGVSFSYDDAIVYPNDTVYLTIKLQTDDPIEYNNIPELQKVIDNLLGKYSVGDANYIDAETIYGIYINQTFIINSKVKDNYNVIVDRSGYDLNSEIQTIVLRIEFEEMELLSPENMTIAMGNVKTEANVRFRILPQRINKIEIKNYHYKQVEAGSKKREQADILKPSDPGLVVIDLVPNNAYYDYLEISDITGDEEIVFIQLVSEDGKAYDIQDISSDGKGIKLYSYSTPAESRLYVRTQISKDYTSKIHTIEVRAYDSDGTKLGESFRKQIDVKMLPEIDLNYMLPDGSVGTNVNSSEMASKSDIYLANGVDALFTIETKNSNSEPERKITATHADGTEDKDFADKYEIVNIVGDSYVLRRKGDNPEISADDIGKKVKLTFRTYMDYGDTFDMAECSIEFVIVDFVIHGVSVNNSIDNLTTKEIYGYYNRKINLNFYFDKTDISYYDTSATGEKFWDTVYELDGENTPENINDILTALNGYDAGKNRLATNDYLILNKNEKDDDNHYKEDANLKQGDNLLEAQKIQLYQNELTVKEGYDKETVKVDGKDVVKDSPKYLAVAFRLEWNDSTTSWDVKKYDTDATTGTYSYVIDKNYKLRFNNVTKWDEPEVVNSEEELYAMESGKQYILNADLVLEKHVPLDVDLLYFDGNGHTITIHSFDTFSGITLNAGLFAQIYPNMIVKNVKVNYVSLNDDGNYSFGNVSNNGGTYTVTHSDLSLGTSGLTSANFGGITPVNNGIITNCVASGLIAVNVAALETTGNYQIPFNIGGLVAENTQTGYITNSRSELSIFSLANIGGFVHSNAGKIASCYVAENTTIYGYNNNLSNTIVSELAGFAHTNTGEISMSYVKMVAETYEYEKANKSNKDGLISCSKVNMLGGSMSAKDMSAGFVYNNSGKIKDAYVQMTKTGVNNNTFSGFVYSNTGSVVRAFTAINGGSRVDTNDHMFAPPSSQGIENCVEFVVQTSGYSSGVSGLEKESATKQYTKSVYENLGFMFGDNQSAVWSMKTGTLPTLVSIQEFKFEDFDESIITYVPDEDVSDGVDNSYYDPQNVYYGTKNNPYIVHDINTWDLYFNYELNFGIMTGYYRIVRDIDFSSIGKNPSTSELVFKGNIQGNNMNLTGIMLYSNEGLDALGLFKKLQAVEDHSVKNSVRNLELQSTSVWASSTQAVGILAGVAEGFNLYNINLNSENLVMVGKNAVGGLAGIVHGEFDIDGIYSNVGVNSTRASTMSNYAIYMSKNNNKNPLSNLKDVYYAGSVVGILDGYKYSYERTNEININTAKYYKVKNINVSGNIVLAGDTVGGAFGLVGERVYVEGVNVNITGSIFGSQYSAGLVGENRGVVSNANIVLADEIYANAKFVCAGVVGLNLGGLVNDVTAQVNISKNDYGYSIGGIVGRNVNGTIANVHFDGELFGYIVGGIVAADYDYDIFNSKTSGGGSLTIECKNNLNQIIQKDAVKYKAGDEIKHLSNLSLRGRTLQFMIDNSNKFYSYRRPEDGYENAELKDVTVKSKVLGLVVGLSYKNSIINKDAEKMEIEIGESGNIIFNHDKFNETLGNEEYILKDEPGEDNDVKVKLSSVNIFNLKLGKNYVMYIIGSTVTSFDSWSSYSDEYILIQ